MRRWPDDMGEALADIAFIEKMERGFLPVKQTGGQTHPCGSKRTGRKLERRK